MLAAKSASEHFFGKPRALFLGAIILLCWAAPARADTIFSDLGTGLTAYQGDTGYTVAGATATVALTDAAMAFTPTANYDLSQIDLGLDFVNGTNSFVISLDTDSSGNPGATLESWIVSGVPSLGSCCVLQTLLPTGTVALASGTQYWIDVMAGASDTWGAWNVNSLGANGNVSQNGGSGDLVLGAFDVLGAVPGIVSVSVTPEPSAWLLLSTGLLGVAVLSFLLRKRTVLA